MLRPEAVEREVTRKIEEAVNPIAGVRHVYSTSYEGLSNVMVEFELEVRINEASQEVRSKIDAIRNEFPETIEEPVVQKLDFGSFPILSLAVRSETLSPRDLTTLADRRIKRRLENISGVGKAKLVGSSLREVSVLVDPARLEALGTQSGCRLRVVHVLSEAGLSGPGPWVGLSPGAAYGPAKRWEPERFAAVGRELASEFGARLVLLGGGDERPVADEVKEQIQAPVVDLVGRTSLRQALGIMSQLKLLVTNDSGLMHAAAALSVPLVALFGSTDPVATGPFTSRATVIRHPQPCSPCFKRTCEIGYTCLTAISADEVAAAARAWLKEGS